MVAADRRVHREGATTSERGLMQRTTSLLLRTRRRLLARRIILGICRALSRRVAQHGTNHRGGLDAGKAGPSVDPGRSPRPGAGAVALTERQKINGFGSTKKGSDTSCKSPSRHAQSARLTPSPWSWFQFSGSASLARTVWLPKTR